MVKPATKDMSNPIADALRSVMKPAPKGKPAPLRFDGTPEDQKRIKSRLAQLDLLEARAKGFMADTADPDRKRRLGADIARIEAIRTSIKAQQSGDDLAECCIHALEERPYKPTRKLSLQEERVDFQALNDKFNEIQGSLENGLILTIKPGLEQSVGTIQSALKAGDVAKALGSAFTRTEMRSTVLGLVRKAIFDAYETGKAVAMKQVGGSRPATPAADLKLMKADAEAITDGILNNLDGVARATVRAGIAADASDHGIAASVRARVQEEASRAIMNASGTVVGQYVNRGNSSVLFDNMNRIVSFQRSEVLDDATCDMCISLDERTVTPDDPAAHMDIVHTHCRGMWVPIFATDEEQPKIGGIPKSIMENFDVVDGRPTVNAFKQLKAPVNRVSQAAQDLIKSRLEAKASA